MNKILLSIIGLSAVVTVGLGTALYIQSERLKASKAELKLAVEEADELEKSCKLLEEQNRKANESLNKMLSDSKKAYEQAEKRLEVITNENDAKDWCADPLPESIQLLFCDISKNSNDEAAGGTARTLSTSNP